MRGGSERGLKSPDRGSNESRISRVASAPPCTKSKLFYAKPAVREFIGNRRVGMTASTVLAFIENESAKSVQGDEVRSQGVEEELRGSEEKVCVHDGGIPFTCIPKIRFGVAGDSHHSEPEGIVPGGRKLSELR